MLYERTYIGWLTASKFQSLWRGTIRVDQTKLCKTPLSEKGRDLTQSYDKSPYTDRTIQKAT